MNREQAKEALSTFKELLDEGLISQQDYDAKKQEIMELLTQNMNISPAVTPRQSTTVTREPPLNQQPNNPPAPSLAPAPKTLSTSTPNPLPTKNVAPLVKSNSKEDDGKRVSQLIEQTLADLLGEPVPWNQTDKKSNNNSSSNNDHSTKSAPNDSSNNVVLSANPTPSPSSATLATGVKSGATNDSALQNVAILQGHTNYVFSLALSPISNVLFSASGDKTIKAWDLETLECTHSLPDHENTVYALTTDDDKHLYSGGWDSQIRVWDLKTLKCQKVLKGHNNYVSALIYGLNHKKQPRLYSGSWDMNVQVWDLNNFSVTDTLLKEETSGKPTNGHTNCVSSLALSSVGSSNGGLHNVVTASYDTTIKLWSSSYRCKQTYRGHSNWVYSIVCAGDLIFSGSRDNTIKIWNAETAQCVATLTDHRDYVSSLALCGNKLYSGSMDKTIKVWDLSTLKCIQTLNGHTNNVYSLLATENTLISASWDKTIRIWQ